MSKKEATAEKTPPPGPERRRLPVLDESSEPSRPRAGVLGKRRAPGSMETELRFRLASFMRISDALISRAVSAYDGLFSLDADEEADFYVDMARSLSAEGRTERALEALRRAAQLRRDDSAIWIEIGVVHLNRNAPQAAVFAFEKAAGLGDLTYKTHRRLAEAWLKLDQPEKAIDELERALALKPESADTAFRLGVALDAQGRYEAAIDALEIAVQLAPEELEYHQTLGFVYESAGERERAVKQFKRALELERAAAAAKPKKRMPQKKKAVG